MIRVYDTSQYDENPILTTYGVDRVPTILEDDFFPVSENDRENAPLYEAECYAAWEPYADEPIVIADIECWDTKDPVANAVAMPKYIRAMEIGREVVSANTRIGLYLPSPNWHEVARKQIEPQYDTSTTYESELAWENSLSPIYPYLDFWVASNYYYGDASVFDPANVMPVYELRTEYKNAIRDLMPLELFWYLGWRDTFAEVLTPVSPEHLKEMYSIVRGQNSNKDEYSWWEGFRNDGIIAFPEYVVQEIISPIVAASTVSGGGALNTSSLDAATLNGGVAGYSETPDGKRNISAIGFDSLEFADNCFIGAASRIYGDADILQIKPDEENLLVVKDIGGLA